MSAADGKRALGAASESVAAEWLEGRGYRVVERNVRRQWGRAWGEVDLIVEAPGGELVVVEVKSRSNPRRELEGLEVVGPRKMRRLRRLARQLLSERDEFIDIRIDVIVVLGDGRGGLRVVRHVENAVEDEDDGDDG